MVPPQICHCCAIYAESSVTSTPDNGGEPLGLTNELNRVFSHAQEGLHTGLMSTFPANGGSLCIKDTVLLVSFIAFDNDSTNNDNVSRGVRKENLCAFVSLCLAFFSYSLLALIIAEVVSMIFAQAINNLQEVVCIAGFLDGKW